MNHLKNTLEKILNPWILLSLAALLIISAFFFENSAMVKEARLFISASDLLDSKLSCLDLLNRRPWYGRLNIWGLLWFVLPPLIIFSVKPGSHWFVHFVVTIMLGISGSFAIYQRIPLMWSIRNDLFTNLAVTNASIKIPKVFNKANISLGTKQKFSWLSISVVGLETVFKSDELVTHKNCTFAPPRGTYLFSFLGFLASFYYIGFLLILWKLYNKFLNSSMTCNFDFFSKCLISFTKIYPIFLILTQIILSYFVSFLLLHTEITSFFISYMSRQSKDSSFITVILSNLFLAVSIFVYVLCYLPFMYIFSIFAFTILYMFGYGDISRQYF